MLLMPEKRSFSRFVFIGVILPAAAKEASTTELVVANIKVSACQYVHILIRAKGAMDTCMNKVKRFFISTGMFEYFDLAFRQLKADTYLKSFTERHNFPIIWPRNPSP
jgi:hypothetical protein